MITCPIRSLGRAGPMRGAKDAAEAVVHGPAAVVPEPSRMAAGRRAAARAAQAGDGQLGQAPGGAVVACLDGGPALAIADPRRVGEAAQGEQVHAQAPAPRQLEIGPPSGGTQPSSWTAWPS